MTIGDLIRLKRKEAKLTQRALAKKIGVSAGAVGQWETDVSLPTAENMAAVKEILGIEAGVIVAPGRPYVGELIEDLDELSIVHFWRVQSDVKREVIGVMLGLNQATARKTM
jgi:transcriptional regulator with XRE-family HTH domain